MSPRKLEREFFARPTLVVAAELLGKIIVYNKGKERLGGRLVEAEAYIGEEDPACHAHRGKTPRNSIMYGPPGFLYVYFTYGNHYMLNLVTEKEGFPAAVLLRAMEPLYGIEIMQQNRGVADLPEIASGPGKLARALGITTDQYGLDITGDRFYLVDDGYRCEEIWTSPRIGLKNGTDRYWRFYLRSNPHVSKTSATINKLARPYGFE